MSMSLADLTKAVQQLQANNVKVEAKLKQLEAEHEQLEAEHEQLEVRVRDLETDYERSVLSRQTLLSHSILHFAAKLYKDPETTTKRSKPNTKPDQKAEAVDPTSQSLDTVIRTINISIVKAGSSRFQARLREEEDGQAFHTSVNDNLTRIVEEARSGDRTDAAHPEKSASLLVRLGLEVELVRARQLERSHKVYDLEEGLQRVRGDVDTVLRLLGRREATIAVQTLLDASGNAWNPREIQVTLHVDKGLIGSSPVLLSLVPFIHHLLRHAQMLHLTPTSTPSAFPTSLGTYERLLVDNLGSVRTVESAIRNLTWFLPGRFQDAEVASEGLYALLSLVSSYHDALLAKRIPRSLSLPPHPFDSQPSSSSSKSIPLRPRISPLLAPPSDHARYTRYWTERSTTYRRASRALVTVGYVELLIEMVARRRGGDCVRWKVVASVESIKSFLRILLLLITRRPVLYPSAPQREYDTAQIPLDVLESRSSTSLNQAPAPQSQPVIPLMRAHAPLLSHLYPLVSSLPDSHLADPLILLPELNPAAYASEMLSSTATLVHVLLLIRLARSSTAPQYRPSSLPTLSRSMHPFLIPMFMQLLARYLRQKPVDSVLLSQHYAHLDRQMSSAFFLRGPMWIGWTRPKVMGVVKFLERIPLVGLVGEFVEAYVPLVDEYFYYTAS